MSNTVGLHLFRKLNSAIRLFLFMMSIMLASSLYAQDKINIESLQKDDSESVWHLFKESNGVSISYQYVSCGPVEYLLFKVQNNSGQKMKISWEFKEYQGNNIIDTNPDDAKISLELNANSSVLNSCATGRDKLAIFLKESGAVLRISSIDIANITITSAN